MWQRYNKIYNSSKNQLLVLSQFDIPKNYNNFYVKIVKFIN